ncbi:DUF6307 family protein [Nakamurella antarctica]|nr:DUF6307 family protein [Nakamurella antarctica]
MNPYETRLALVVSALKAEKVHLASGMTLIQTAVTVLAAIDKTPWSLR